MLTLSLPLTGQRRRRRDASVLERVSSVQDGQEDQHLDSQPPCTDPIAATSFLAFLPPLLFYLSIPCLCPDYHRGVERDVHWMLKEELLSIAKESLLSRMAELG